jgi:hypothetical protein
MLFYKAPMKNYQKDPADKFHRFPADYADLNADYEDLKSQI